MYNGLILSTLLLIILFFLGIIISFFINIFLIPIIMTPKKVLEEILKIINPKKDNVVYDLGSGDGRVLFALKQKEKIKGVGVELSPILVSIAKITMKFKLGFRKDIRFEVESMFNTDLSNADIIYCHLTPQALEILKNKFENELKKGSVVYTYNYEIPRKRGKKHELSNGKVLWEYIY